MTNGRVVHCRSSMVLVGFLTLMVGNCLVSSMAFAGEFCFMTPMGVRSCNHTMS